MATKKTAAEQGLQQKVKVLTKLFVICTPNTGHPVLGVLLYEIQL